LLRAPELDAGLLGGSHQSGAEGQNPLLHPAGHALLMQPRIRVANHNRRNPENFIVTVARNVMKGMREFTFLFSKYLNSSGIKVLEF